MLVQWDQLNPTEQYFNLLEAWLRFGRAEMVGERGRAWGDLLLPCLQTWRVLPEKGRRFDLKKPQEVYLYGIGRDFYLLALMDLFGLVEVEQPPRPVTPWSPAGVKHVPFGDAVFTLLASVGSMPSWWTMSPTRRGGRGPTRKGGRKCLASGPGSRCSSRISRSGGRT